MKVVFLGTGTSQGVPVIACSCEVCKSKDECDNRLRSSVFIETDDAKFVIDSGPDFRYQMLRAGVKHLDAIIFTHEHKDHVAGLDDVRAFNWINKSHMEVYAEDRVLEAVKVEFAYSFRENPYPGVPKINLNSISNKPFKIKNTIVTPIRGLHLKLPIFGYRIGDFAYLTDFNYIADSEKEKLKGLKCLVVNGVRKEKHISHFNLEEAVDLIQEINPQYGFVTHISHQLGLHHKISRELPDNIKLAFDQMVLEM